MVHLSITQLLKGVKRKITILVRANGAQTAFFET